MFKVNTKGTRTKSMTLNNFEHISLNSVSVVGLEYRLGILNDINHSPCISSVSEKPGKYHRVSVLLSIFLINLNL